MNSPECCCVSCCGGCAGYGWWHWNSMKVFVAPIIIFFIRIPIFITPISYIQMTWCRWPPGTFYFPLQRWKSFYLKLILFSTSPSAIILIYVYIVTSMNFTLSTQCSSRSFIRNFIVRLLSFHHRIMNFSLISCKSLNKNLKNIILASIIILCSILFLYFQFWYLLILLHIFKRLNYL